jgi:hypothetical protein
VANWTRRSAKFGTDEEGIGARSGKRGKGCIDFADCRGCLLHLLTSRFGTEPPCRDVCNYGEF